MGKPSLGTVCIVLGVLLMLAAGGLYAYNRYEDAHAGAEAQTVVQDLEEKVVEKTETAAESTPEEMTAELPSVFVDGYDYVGVLTIPALDLRLPVMQDWSYPKLKIAPCRQYGSSRTNDLVIAAHNYETHFGKIVPSPWATRSASPIWTASTITTPCRRWRCMTPPTWTP